MSVATEISAEDLEAIEQLRKSVKEYLTPYYDKNFNLLRWLKGHNYSFDEIIPKLKNHLAFRKSGWNLDAVALKPRNHPIHQYLKSGLGGEAVKTPNTIINVERTGTNDYWGILQTFPLNEIMKARVYDLEVMLKKVMETEAKTGHQTSVIFIMDLDGLTFDRKHFALNRGAMACISDFISEHYVELIHSFVLINAPTFISVIWKIVQPLLPERTRNKVKIFGNNWKSDILEIAVPESLPAYWNLSDELPISLANISVKLPVDGYYNGDEQAETLSVAASKTGFIERIGNEGQKLKWIFETDGHFAYGIYFTKDSKEEDISKMECVYPRFNKVPGPTCVPLCDEIVLPKTGVYKLWFSNEHAYFHTLKIRHFINVE